jgi:hypothetical protein
MVGASAPGSAGVSPASHMRARGKPRFGGGGRALGLRSQAGRLAPVWLLLALLAPGCGRRALPAAPLPRSVPAAPAGNVREPLLAQFTDVTAAAGIRFQHTNGGSGRKYLPETMGSGCAFLDYDGDGWLDLLLLNGRLLSEFASGSRTQSAIHTAALYHNNRDGTFTDVTRGSGLDVTLYAMGCCVGDYDNDGRDDLYVTTCLEPHRLFHNEGGGKFRDLTAAAGVGDRRWGTSCAWVDFDNDGWLDLFVCNYLRFRSLKDDRFCSLVANHKSYCPPGAYAGEACLLYHNNRDGTFTDVSRATGIGRYTGNALGVTILDWDGDGWMDLVVANDETPNYLFHNIPAVRGQRSTVRRRFEEIGMETGFAVAENGKPKAGMGIDGADYRNDGGLGILVSNFSNEGLSFYRKEGDLLSEEAFATGFGGPSLLTLGFGLFFFDMDNDGLKDAFVVNGHVNDDIQLIQSNLTYAQRPLLFRNRGNGSFEEVTGQAGAPLAVPMVGRGAAYGDYDNDGDLDLLLTTNNGPARLLRNDGGSRQSWLEVLLRGTGTGGSNRSGIGARVQVKAEGRVMTDRVRSGSSYLSQSMLRLHFGLGRAARAEWVRVRWSSGAERVIRNVSARRVLVVEEPEAPGAAAR